MKIVLRRWLTTASLAAAAMLAACSDGDGGTGTDPLTAPTGVNVTTTSRTATITFSAVPGATGYVIQRAPGATGGTFADVGTTTTTTFTDQGLTPGAAYRYQVAATRTGETSPFSGPVTAIASDLAEATITSDINGNRTFSADTIYTLGTFIHVNSGTLTIQPGTRIEGQPNSALFIMPGAQINANGTAAAPIVFTSASPEGQRQPGDWGGLVLIGQGQINRAGNVILEGTGTNNTTNDTIFYSGGTAAGDAGTSGTLRYVRIEFAGFGPLPDAELNSLTLAAVGSGTTIEYVQTLAGLDDSFEWFGGAVNAKYLVSYESGDDHFDASEGYRGRVQYMIGLQTASLPPRPGAGNVASDPQGIENDGCGSAGSCPAGFNSTPLNTPMFANFTLVGTGPGVVGAAGGFGMVLRRGTGGYYVNGILARWPNAAISIRDADTNARIAVDSLMIRNLVLAQNGNAFEPTGSSTRYSVDLAANNIRVEQSTLAQLFTAFPTAVPTTGTINWTPPTNSPAATGGTGAFTGVLAAKAGNFVTGTPFVGAAAPAGGDPAASNWWAGWTRYARN